jgi:hypothetical protein
MKTDFKANAPGNKDSHYVGDIQPIDFIVANRLDAVTANICKYVTRYKSKNGKEDLEKALWYLNVLRMLENGELNTEIDAEMFSKAQNLDKYQTMIMKSIEDYTWNVNDDPSLDLDKIDLGINMLLKEYHK